MFLMDFAPLSPGRLLRPAAAAVVCAAQDVVAQVYQVEAVDFAGRHDECSSWVVWKIRVIYGLRYGWYCLWHHV